MSEIHITLNDLNKVAKDIIKKVEDLKIEKSTIIALRGDLGSGKTTLTQEITNHSEQTIEIISIVPDGGNYKNLPLALQQTRNVHIAWTRLNSNKPSFTIDTGHRHHFHYKFNRIPTVRESARIQSFPDSFIFLGSKTSQYKQDCQQFRIFF